MTNNDSYNKQLINEIAYLKRLNKELLQQVYQDDVTKFPWLGNLGQWFWDFPQNIVTFNPLKATTLGYSQEDIPSEAGFEFFTDKLHPEDYDNVMDEMRAHLKGIAPVWEVKYRIQAKDGSWKVFYDRGKVTQWSDDHKPLFLVGNVFDVTEEENQKQQLLQKSTFWRTKAEVDSLTKLHTRAILEERLNAIHQVSLWNQKTYTILLLDIDHFKNINDTYGHLVGDETLRTVGELLRSNIRDSDIAGRYGGEEFLIVFPDSEVKAAQAFAERIKNSFLAANLPFQSKLTFSAGIASSSESTEISKLIEIADRRMYSAKQNGRNQTMAE